MLALDLYVEALGLWHGPGGDGMHHSPAAVAIFAQLNDEFLDASVAAAELAVVLGQPERVLPPLHLAAGMAPFHEPVQASLVTPSVPPGSRRRPCRSSERCGLDSLTSSASTRADP